MIEIDRVLHEQIRALGSAAYKKFLCGEVIKNWSRLVDEEIAAQVVPVAIERGVLFVRVDNSAFKDQLKFFKEEILAAINETFGQSEPLVKNIRITRVFILDDKKNLPAPVDEPKEIVLTEEEIKSCEEQAEKFPEDLRPTILNALMAQVKGQKVLRANGWHKCANCSALCPPEEKICDVCKIKERDVMVKKLLALFRDTPWLKSQDAQKILLKQMPHMRKECSLAAIDSARSSLIQSLARRVRFGDETSPDALKLVMLTKRLPPDKLTSAIIKRALSELRFNLAS